MPAQNYIPKAVFDVQQTKATKILGSDLWRTVQEDEQRWGKGAGKMYVPIFDILPPVLEVSGRSPVAVAYDVRNSYDKRYFAVITAVEGPSNGEEVGGGSLNVYIKHDRKTHKLQVPLSQYLSLDLRNRVENRRAAAAVKNTMRVIRDHRERARRNTQRTLQELERMAKNPVIDKVGAVLGDLCMRDFDQITNEQLSEDDATNQMLKWVQCIRKASEAKEAATVAMEVAQEEAAPVEERRKAAAFVTRLADPDISIGELKDILAKGTEDDFKEAVARYKNGRRPEFPRRASSVATTVSQGLDEEEFDEYSDSSRRALAEAQQVFRDTEDGRRAAQILRDEANHIRSIWGNLAEVHALEAKADDYEDDDLYEDPDEL